MANAPVGLIDLYPTLAELCGVKAPESLQGQSLVPMLKDPDVMGRGWTLSQVTRGRRKPETRFFGYTLRTPRWRYTEWAEGDQGRELYDHDADPRELTNLADDPAHAEAPSPPLCPQRGRRVRAEHTGFGRMESRLMPRPGGRAGAGDPSAG